MPEIYVSILILLGVDVGLQWICFPVAYALKTERFFDLVGALTHLSVTWLGLGLLQALHIRGYVQCACISLWCVRLGAYLMYRAYKHGDARFHEIKSSCPRFFVTWTMQAMWVAANLAPSVGMLAEMNSINSNRELGDQLHWRDYTGWALFLIGLITETVADLQKLSFKSKEENRGKFINTGLWAISRHPNYFGEILLWLGLALSASGGFLNWPLVFTLCGPVINICLILFVSGVPMLEKSGLERWGDQPEYQQYVKKVGVVVPFLPIPLCGCCKP